MKEIVRIPLAEGFDSYSGSVPGGPIQLGNDWPGTFFRGDTSGSYSDRCRLFARWLKDGPTDSQRSAMEVFLLELADDFGACQVKL